MFSLNYQCFQQLKPGVTSADLLFGRNIRLQVRPSLENDEHAKQENWPGFKTKEHFSMYNNNYGLILYYKIIKFSL